MKEYSITVRVTILNDMSNKKRRINVEGSDFIKAIEQANCKVHHVSENIIKAEIWNKKTIKNS